MPCDTGVINHRRCVFTFFIRLRIHLSLFPIVCFPHLPHGLFLPFSPFVPAFSIRFHFCCLSVVRQLFLFRFDRVGQLAGPCSHSIMRGSLGWMCHDRMGDHVPSNCEHGPRILPCKVLTFQEQGKARKEIAKEKREKNAFKRAENRNSMRRRWLNGVNNRSEAQYIRAPG